MSAKGTEHRSDRAPAWEKLGKRRYYAVLAVALLLSAVCLFSARQERLAGRAALVSFLESGSEIYVPRTAGEFAAVINMYTEEWRRFAGDIERGVANNADRGYFVELTNGPFNKDAKVRNVWIHLEPEAMHGKHPFAVMRDNHGVRFGTAMAYENMQGDYYSELSERSSMRFFIAAHKKLLMDETRGVSGFTLEESLRLTVDGPLLFGGDHSGIAGLGADIRDAYDYFIEAAGSTGMEMFLIDPDGTVLVSTRGGAAGEPYSDIPDKNFSEALNACAERVTQGKTFDSFISGTGAAMTFAAYAPVDAGEAGGTWFVAGLRDVGGGTVGRKWAFAVFFIWFIAVVGVLVIHGVEKRMAAMAADKQLLAAMRPETAGIFKKLNRWRGRYYMLCMLFFVPGMLFLSLADKRYQEAKKSADAEAAQKAIASMRNIAVVCAIIGCAALFLNIAYR